jgi:thiamine pyrophosphate-dependent acetolactate synthase large subunit-like protein
MTRNTVAHAILRTLAGAGVDTVFGLPGVHNLAFWIPADGLPNIIGTRHEQTAVYAADGLARASGRLGVALTTTGPGVANAVAAFGEAASCGSPVLLISSESSTNLTRAGVVRGSLHESADQASIFESLAKAVFRPRAAADAVRAVAEGAALAMQWPRGPVYIDVPTDVLERSAEPVKVAQPHRSEPHLEEVESAIRLIESSQNIVLWIGGGVVASDAGQVVGELAERLGAPIIETWAGRGAVGSSHPWTVGLPPHEPEVAALMRDADLMIAVGTAFDGPSTKNWTMPRPPLLISINADPIDVAKNYEPDVAVVGDARVTVMRLIELLKKRESDPEKLNKLRTRVRAFLESDEKCHSAIALIDAVDAVVARHDATVINDMAVAGYWVGGYGKFESARRMQYPIGWGTLGYALPASVGVGALRERPALVVCGDGGFMFAIGELAVLVEQNLPVTLLLVDDGGYGMLRFDQSHTGDPHRGVDLVRPDFAALSAAFGITCTAPTLSELERSLDEALTSNEPRIVLLNISLYPPRTTSARWSE